MHAPSLSRDPVITIAAEVAPPQKFGRSMGFERRCVPILGGTVSGALIGHILPGGTDWQRIFDDGSTEIEAHYAIETAYGTLVEVHSAGIRSGPPEVMAALLAGEPVDASQVYFRTAIRLMSSAPQHRALTRKIHVGVGRREPSRVLIDVHSID